MPLFVGDTLALALLYLPPLTTIYARSEVGVLSSLFTLLLVEVYIPEILVTDSGRS